MALAELYTKYNRVWIPDPENVWKSAEITKDYKPGEDVLEIQLEDGTEIRYPLDPVSQALPPLRNPDILVGENDLTALSYLHEPAVLHNLKVRFMESKLIYTYSGIILVAINPYKQLPIYGEAIIHAYSGQNMGDMDPHIFAVAEEAYKQMARNNKNQSIIVSGESGAGKTVSARYAMRYFATVSKSGSKTRVEDKVLASNPITEAIGNAKTTRNDNSSRFGKYTEISFDRRYQIIGANMRTYLLEKSRVVFQSENERNYHIFYQLCACADQPEFQNLKLGKADEFKYTSMGGMTYIDGVNDKSDMAETRRTFSLLGLNEDFQMDVFKVLAAILHLGNVHIKAVSDEKSAVSLNDQHLNLFCQLLDVNIEGVSRWLCNRSIITASETVVKPMPRHQAVNARDALAKQIYSHLFDCIIDRINKALQFPGKQHTFIGVLDIYGFETFEINSFEQFCINYANEKLQQQFNLHVFKLEQEEYMKEDIPWTLIDFYDNQPVIDLIEAKMGILDLLDEECLFPQGTDENWLQKLYNNYLDKNALFEKPRMSNKSFIIQHFADKVEYKCQGFLEKNRDTMYEELIGVLRASHLHLLASFFQEDEPTSPFRKSITFKPARPLVKPSNKQLKTTVGNKFRSSLYMLMDTLNATTPHYVRCIKPNEEKLPFEYDSKRVVQQLRACGVLETIRISAQSYPSRWTYIEFYSRYSILMTQKELAGNDKKQTCKTVLQRLIHDSNQYKFGRTKIFFRAGQVAYLEKLRSDRLRAACITIQKNFRGWIQRKKFVRMRAAAIIIQQYVRGQRTIRQTVSATTIKQAWAAIIIQKHCRGFLVRRVYQLVQVATITIQAFARGWIARKRFKKILEDYKASILQKYARAWLARRRFQSIRRVVLNVQLSYRVQRLQKKLEEQTKENHVLLERLTGLASAHSHDLEKLHKLEENLKKTMAQKKALEEEMRRVTEETSQIITQLQSQNATLNEEKQELNLKLQEELQEMKDNVDDFQKKLMADLDREERQRKMLENDFAIQKEDYEKQIDSLKEEIKCLREEKMQLQQQVQEEFIFNDELKQEIAQLAREAEVIPGLKQEVVILETQKSDLEKKNKEQMEHTKVKMAEVTKQLLEGLKEEETLSRLSAEDLNHINDSGELTFVYEGLKKAASVMEKHFQAQKEGYQKETETLNFKIQHLQGEVCHLQNLFKEENTVKDSIRQELNRLSSENMVIPEYKQQISELQRQKKELEVQIKDQAVEMKDKMEETIDQLHHELEQVQSQCRMLEVHVKDYDKEKQVLLEKVKKNEQENEDLRKKYEAENEAKTKLRQETTRLSAEKMDFEEQIDAKDRLIKRLQSQIQAFRAVEKANQVQAPPVPKEYIGMLEYKSEDEAKLIKHLILDLKPRGVVVNMIPGLPAHLLFMCVRYADYMNDAAKLKSLMNSIVNGLKDMIKDHPEDFETLSFWLSNAMHFLNCLKQYSGEEEFMKHNTSRQNKNCLKNFDISEYRQILSDLAIRIYQQFIKVMEKNLQPIIVPGMLEYESLQGISSMKPTGFRKRSSSIYEDAEVLTINSILQQLSHFHSAMCQHGMDPELIKQSVKQLFFLIGADTLNGLFLRKDMCSCRKGMQIRCNISYLEEWLKEKNLQSSSAIDTMEPLSQAAWLLQVNKSTEEDAKEICERCSSLSSVQIVKILNSYTPIDDFEKRVAPSFVRKVQSFLQGREGTSQLMLDAKYLYQVTFPYSASPQALETIQVPSSLKLGFLTRL
ncbi:MYO5C protein, partial [Polypterus senegalus]|nr:unconventional myosin-Vc [Polypterus senegalus]MBN3292049.1 MYO5C protein [Polypterus senegalus]